MMRAKEPLLDLLSFYMKAKSLTESEARSILLLPLIEIPEIGVDVDSEWCRFLDLPENQNPNESLVDRDDFILLHAAYFIPNFGVYVFKLKQVTAEEELEYAPIEIDVELLFSIKNADSKPVRITGHMTVNQHITEDINFQNVYVHYRGRKERISADTKGNKNAEITMRQLIYGFRILRYFNRFQDSLDKYPVHVSRVSTKRLSISTNTPEKRLKALNTPRIVYLNALPEEHVGTPTVPGAVVNPRKLHQRKGYWKTLKHERYSKHPKYLEKDAIRVKPSWVGSVKTEYEGNVYRVLLPNTVKED